MKLKLNERKPLRIDRLWFLSVLKSLNYLEYRRVLATFVTLHERKKINQVKTIPSLIRSDWAEILKSSKTLTINSNSLLYIHYIF